MAIYYPPVGFHFAVKFQLSPPNFADTRFQEVSGLSSEVGIEEIEEGGENRYTHRLPTRVKYGNLVLKRGLLTDSGLIKWCKKAIENLDFETTTVNVILLDENHIPVGDTFSFVKAYPVKWSISDFKAQENSIVVETLELAYSYFTRVRL